MKMLYSLALASAIALSLPTTAFAESQGCKAPVEAAAPDIHSHCGATAPAHERGAVYSGTGSIARVDKAAGNITIAHEPVEALQWPAMTMRFGVDDKALLRSLAPGKKVKFQFVQRGAQYVITALN